MATKQKPAPQSELIKVAALRRTHAKAIIIGDTPLIVHAWSQKAKLQMLAKHMGRPLARVNKDPYEDFLQSMYQFDDGNYGFPVVALKEAMATVTADLEGIARAQVYRNVVVTGRRGFSIGVFADIKSPTELAEVFSPNAPQVREDMVRLSGISRDPDIRYRAEFWPWALEFSIAYDPQIFDSEATMNLLGRAGFTVGLGEWRQEKGGSNGLFHTATVSDVAMVAKWKKAGPKAPTPIDSKAWLAKALENAPTKDRQPLLRKTKGNGSDGAVLGSVQ